uniref:Ribonuclease H-like domain-containing protein n=1 Tax=Tanacetum cinerariifolium TaxID=118510 RepID=A0A6L2KF29_TANCI|nr:ribonuclease H-like domain-containing protein [Tanacetum cinerariifolium]
MSFDDLYNNFKIVEQEVKETTSSSSSSQNMAFVSSPSSTNEVNTAYRVSTANTQVSPASTQVSTASTQYSTANLSDATDYAFLASQPYGSQLAHEDLIQIHEDDLEEIDLKWQVIFTSKLDLSNTGLEDFQQPEFKGYGPKTSNSVSEDISNEVKESPDASLVKELVSDDKLEKKLFFLLLLRENLLDLNNKKNQLGNQLREKSYDSGCSRHMTGNMSYLFEYEEIGGGYVAFRGDPKRGKITGKGKISTDTECVVLSPDFKLLKKSQVLLKVLRKNNMYSVDLKNVAPSGGKFNGKADERFFVGYFVNSKAFRIFNSRTRITKETLHITFLENKPNVTGSGLTWLFDIDTLTKSINYVFKGLHRVIVAHLVLMVYKVTAVFNKVNADKLRVTIAVRVSIVGWIKWLEDQDIRVNEIYYKKINQENVESRSDKRNHVVPPPYTGNYIPPKLDLMFIDEQVKSESVDVVSNVSFSAVKTVESKVESVDVKNKEKIAQEKEIAKLNKRVKKLEKKRKSRPAGLRRLKKVGSSNRVESSEKKDSLGAQEDAFKQGRSIKDIDQDAETALVDEYQGKMHDAYMFRVDDLEGNEVIVDVREKIIEKEVSTGDPVTTAGEVVTVSSVKDSVAPTTATNPDVDDELTLEKTLIAIKATKPKIILTAITTPRAKSIVFHEQVQAHIPTVSSSKDKGKAKMIDPKKPLKKKDQIALGEEVARKLEAEMRAKMKEEERIAIEKDEVNRAVIEEWDDVQAIFDADRQRKYFAAKRAKGIRNKPPTKRVNTFVDIDTENVEKSLKKTQAEGSSKRVGQELEQESTKKQKLAEQEQAKIADDDTAEMKRCLELVPEDDDDLAIEATPISSKSPTIVDYRIYREGKKSYFKIIKAYGNSQNYLTFGTMFKNFNREDLEVLRSIVKERFKKTKLVDDRENLLFQTLKTMFEPHVEDIIWKYQQGAVKVKWIENEAKTDAYSFNDTSNNFTHPPHPQYETYLFELCGNDSHCGYDCPPQFPLHAQPEDTNELLHKLLEDLQIISEELAEYINSPSWNCPTFYNNDEEHSSQYKKYLENSSNVITPDLPTKEPEYSLSMGDEHLSTILETESDEVLKSSVKNLVPILSESEVTSDNESDCNVPVKDESSLIFTTFLNPLFDCNDDFTSSDDKSLSNKDVLMEKFKIYLNPLFNDKEIISNKIDPNYFNAESNLIEYFPNQDTLFDSSPKFDYLEEFSGELMPTGIINEERIKREHEEYISLMEKLLTINSFPRPLENFHANTIIKTPSTSPIPVDDSDSLREEIDIFTGTDDLMPPSIESDDYASEGDIYFLKNYLAMIPFPFPKMSHLILIIMMIHHFLVKWIENRAKTGIYGFGLIKSAYYSKSRQSHDKSPRMLLERARENESIDKDLIKKLKDSRDKHQVYRRIIGFKGLHGVTTAQLGLLAKELKIYSLGSINYKPIVVGNQSNGSACKARIEMDSLGNGFKPSGEEEKKDAKDLKNEDYEALSTEEPRVNQEKDANVNNTNNINTASLTVNAASIKDNAVNKDTIYGCADDPNMPNLEEINFSDDDEDVGAKFAMTNLDSNISVSPIPTTRIHKDHPVEQIIRDIHSAP